MTKHQELLDRSIRESQLTRTQFAERLLSRDERTVRRWLKDTDDKQHAPIPPAVQRWLERWNDLSAGRRQIIIGALT